MPNPIKIIAQNALKSILVSGQKIALQLANNPKSQKLEKNGATVISQVVANASYRTRQDTVSWRAAMMLAEKLEKPKRTRLMQVYGDVVLDNHLTSLMETRKLRVIGTPFKITDAKGKESEHSVLLNRTWFFDYLHHVLDAIFYGHSLVELGSVADGEIQSVAIIPRQHLAPLTGEIYPDISKDNTINYRDNPMFMQSLVEIGKPNDLGLLLKAAPHALYKKNVQAAWAEFVEIFGMPIRIGKVASRVQADIDRMEQFLKEMGQSAYAVIGEQDEVTLRETSRGDAYNVFNIFIERCNTEMSKLIVGQTMTTDNGSSRSQGEVHERIFDDYLLADRNFVAGVINQQLLPKLSAMGYPFEGLQFDFCPVEEITETDLKMDEMLLSNFEFKDLEYFAKKYNVPITAIKKQNNASATPANLSLLLHRELNDLYTHTHAH
jgi:hypothetical protein